MGVGSRSEDSQVTRFFRNPKTGRIVVAQRPNLPLWIFLAATAIRLLIKPDGLAGATVSTIATGALLLWATLEITRGESAFRRALGTVVVLVTVVGWMIT